MLTIEELRRATETIDNIKSYLDGANKLIENIGKNITNNSEKDNSPILIHHEHNSLEDLHELRQTQRQSIGRMLVNERRLNLAIVGIVSIFALIIEGFVKGFATMTTSS